MYGIIGSLQERVEKQKALRASFSHLAEVLKGVDPDEAERVIKTSFQDRVISDLLADETHRGDLVPAMEVLKELRQQFPHLAALQTVKIRPNVERVRIYFNEHGAASHIEIPSMLKKGLGGVLILHEIAHMLYTKDLLTNKIVQHRSAPQAFTLLRVLEDIAIERQLEKEHPDTVQVFQTRAQHIIPLYKTHTPSLFAKKVDDLFLFLRGYKKQYTGDPQALDLANKYLQSANPDEKIDAIVSLADLLSSN